MLQLVHRGCVCIDAIAAAHKDIVQRTIVQCNIFFVQCRIFLPKLS